MPVQVFVGSKSAASNAAAQKIAAAILRVVTFRKFVLGTATGSSPIELYALLVAMVRSGMLSFEDVVCFGLDEYLGLSPDDPQSYHYFMTQHLWEPAGVPADQRHLPDPAAPEAYEGQICEVSGGIDIQILGIGRKGHIGFNEAGSPRNSRTRIADLATETIEDAAEAFGGTDKAPRRAVTAGMSTIMDFTGEAIMLAWGAAKDQAVWGMLEGPIGMHCPASELRNHKNVTVYLDHGAARLLTETPFSVIPG